MTTMTLDYARMLYDDLPIPIWLAGLNSKWHYFNKSWLEFTGRSMDEEIDSGWMEGVHPDDREHVRHVCETAFHAHTSFEVEFQLRHASGEYRWVMFIGRPHFNENGELAGFIGTIHDMTHHRAMEAALQERDAMFEGLFEHAPDGILAVDEHGIIQLVNRQLLAMFGYSADELVGQPLHILLPEEHQQHHDELVQHFMVHPRTRPMGAVHSLVARRRSGEVFPADIALGPVQLPNRRLVLATVRDITDRKKAEEELRLYRNHLEDLVAARTRDLEREVQERQKAEQKLARSNRDLQDFASIVSHDLQEPLRKITAFGKRLERKYGDVLDADGKDYLRRMIKASERMQKMLNTLLEYSRLNTRALPFEPTDLNRTVADVLSDLEVRIQESNGQVQVGELPVIEAERMQMRQLFQNLIGNALKFHRSGVPPKVCIWAEEPDGPQGERVRLLVSDNGIGFNEQYLDKIFHPFQRLHGRSDYEGSGMGLAICRGIVERHGGSITARSKEGEGSTFIIELPRLQTSQEQ